ncbi:Predicted AAA-ATPase [Ectothiorhodospira marina]|uniref:Predicted AAA-ATPase n=2 Tax=Ectothiorhodospira marina TaxID=1396821 RepID=A0A1H7I7D0_9GAMM|nr:Predicted AAA-ATPase [Ectothiorhodospira marina]
MPSSGIGDEHCKARSHLRNDTVTPLSRLDMPQKRNLPIGVQAFEKIRRGGHYYVDRTPHLLRLVSESGYFFLSRPCRFWES